MKKNMKGIALALALGMAVSAAPLSVSAATVKTPAKVTLSSVERSGQTAKVTWKKLKTTPSGYAVYQKKGTASWKLMKRASKTSTSASLSAKSTESNQFKVRAYNTYKQKQYYNKKTKKWETKKPAAKYIQKTKTVTKYKYGSYSTTKTLSAVATKKYTISFDSQGGSTVKAQSLAAGSAITFAAPTKEGYEFLGWYDAKEGGNKVTTAKATKNVTYYAQWKQIIDAKPSMIYIFKDSNFIDGNDLGAQYLGISVSISANEKLFEMTEDDREDDNLGTTENLRFVVEKKYSGASNWETVDDSLAWNNGKNHFKTSIYDYDVDPTTDCTYRAKAVGVTTDGETISSKYFTVTVEKEDYIDDITDHKVITEGKYCSDCKTNVTELSEEELQANHGTTYYCSECGDDPDEGFVSHSKSDVESHIAEMHADGSTEDTDSEIDGDTETDGTPEIQERDSWVEQNSDYDITESVTHTTSWKELDSTSEEYQEFLNANMYKSADKIFIDENSLEGFERYFIIGGVRSDDYEIGE